MHRRITLAAAFLVCVFAPGLPAQLASPSLPQQPQTTFRSKIELVRVDAVVVDKNGNAIRGLTAADFALTDRKTPQTIATFEEISHARGVSNAPGTPALPLTLKADVASNVGVQADRLVIVVIDDLHIWKGRTDTARALARDLVTRLGRQASMGVIFTSREGSTEVTQDRSVLLAAIDGMKARQTFRRPHQGFLDPKAAYVDQDDPHFMDKKFDAVNTAQRASLQEFEDDLVYFETLKNAAAMMLGEDQRRKAFVLISEGMNIDTAKIAAGASTNVVEMGSATASGELQTGGVGADAMLDTMKAMRRANVAMYAIDPRGKVRPEDMMLELWPPPDCAVCNNPAVPPAPSERLAPREDLLDRRHNPVFVSQDGLIETSEARGGFAVTNTDDLAGGLGRILDDLDHYYLLGFYPADTRSSSHPVALTVPGHPDYTVRFRRGYTPDPPPPAPSKNVDPLVELAAGVMPKSDLPLRLTALPLIGSGKTSSVAVALEVTAPTGSLKDADNKLRDDVTYSVLVVDDKKSKVTSRVGRSAKLSLSGRDENMDAHDTVTYQIPLTLDLAPGHYQLRASALSQRLDKGGSVYLDLVVPDFTKAPLVLSGIALGFADGAHVPVGRAVAVAPAAAAGAVSEAAAPDRVPFDMTLAREFAESDTLSAYFEVARADATSAVSLTISLIDSDDRTALTIDQAIGPNEPGRKTVPLPLSLVGPGASSLGETSQHGGHGENPKERRQRLSRLFENPCDQLISYSGFPHGSPWPPMLK